MTEKMYYAIGEVAEMFGENTSLIRFWANRFHDVIKPKKNNKGNRMFTQILRTSVLSIIWCGKKA